MAEPDEPESPKPVKYWMQAPFKHTPKPKPKPKYNPQAATLIPRPLLPQRGRQGQGSRSDYLRPSGGYWQTFRKPGELTAYQKHARARTAYQQQQLQRWGEEWDRKQSYWDNPVRIARYHNALKALPPGTEPPPWLNKEEIDLAYEYMSQANNGAPWWQWKYLNRNDPGLQLLRNMQSPPQEVLWPGEQPKPPQPKQVYQPAEYETLAQPAMGGMNEEQFNKLLPWQKALVWLGGQNPMVQAGGMGAAIGLATGGLPGLAVGTALGVGLGAATQMSPGAANILMKLDYPAEWFERALGTLGLGYGRAIGAMREGGFYAGADAAADIINNLPAAWKAAHLTYETLPVGRTWQFTSPVPQTNIGWASFNEAYERIRDGERPEAVWNDVATRMGATGQGRELLGHIVLDPLNVLGGLGVLAGFLPAVATGNRALQLAAMAARGPGDMLRQYGAILRATTPTGDIAKLGLLSRWLGGVNAAGQATDLAKKGGKGIFNYLFSLTPQARATEVVNNSATVTGAVLDKARNAAGEFDPQQGAKYLHGVANTPLNTARELSMQALAAPDAAAIPLALKDHVDKIDNIAAAWEASQPRLNVLAKLGDLTGRTLEEVVVDLADEAGSKRMLAQIQGLAARSDAPEAQELLLAMRGQQPGLQRLEALDAKALVDLAKPFQGKDGLPMRPEMVKATMQHAVEDLTAQWAVDWFGVKPDPGWVRMANTVKSAQSLVLLGFNPTYFLNNSINNLMTVTSEGLFGMRSPGAIQEIWNRAGIQPPRLRAGIGVDAGGLEQAHRIIQEATGTTGTLETARRGLERTRRWQVFGRLSGWNERASSEQAVTSGFLQFMSRNWRKDVGFSPMPAPLEQRLAAIDPGLPKAIYSIIEGGWNQAEIEKKIWQGLARRTVLDGVPEIARRTGIPEADVAEVLHTVGAASPEVAEQLAKAADDTEVNQILGDIERKAQDHLDKLNADNLEIEAAKAAARVDGEGAQAALEIFDQMSYDYSEHWFNHFVHMDVAAQQADQMEGTARSLVWENAFADARRGWDRLNAQQEAQMAGIARGLGLDSDTGRRSVGYLQEQHNTWTEFYRYRDEQYRIYGRGEANWNQVSEQIYAAWEAAYAKQETIFDQMDAEYVRLFANQFGVQAGEVAKAWRKGIKDIRAKMHTDMLEHRAMGVQSWREFLRGPYFEGIRALYEHNIEGAREMWRVATGGKTPPPGPAAPTTPELADIDWKLGGSNLAEGRAAQAGAEAVAPTTISNRMHQQLLDLGYSNDQMRDMTPQKAWEAIGAGENANVKRAAVRQVAAQLAPSQLATATPEGQPRYIDQYILNVINKHGEQQYKDLADVDMDVAIKAITEYSEQQTAKAIQAEEARQAQQVLDVEAAIKQTEAEVPAPKTHEERVVEAAKAQAEREAALAEELKIPSLPERVRQLYDEGMVGQAFDLAVSASKKDIREILKAVPELEDRVNRGRRLLNNIHSANLEAVPEEISNRIGEILETMRATIQDAEEGGKRFEEGKFVEEIKSTYPTWYEQVSGSYKGMPKNKHAVLAAIGDISTGNIPEGNVPAVVSRIMGIVVESLEKDDAYRKALGYDIDVNMDIIDVVRQARIEYLPDNVTALMDELQAIEARVYAYYGDPTMAPQEIIDNISGAYDEVLKRFGELDAIENPPKPDPYIEEQVQLMEAGKVAQETWVDDVEKVVPEVEAEEHPFGVLGIGSEFGWFGTPMKVVDISEVGGKRTVTVERFTGLDRSEVTTLEDHTIRQMEEAGLVFEKPQAEISKPSPGVTPAAVVPEAPAPMIHQSSVGFQWMDTDINLAFVERAYSGVSWEPERRAARVRQDYIEHMQAVVDKFTPLADTPEKQEKLALALERYRKGYLDKLNAYLSAKSRVVSSWIAGPSKFPVEQMNKRADIEGKRLNEFLEWSRKTQETIRKEIAPETSRVISSDQPEAIALLQQKIARLEDVQSRMVAGNKIVRQKALTDDQKIAQLMELGLTEDAAREALRPDYAGRLGFPDYKLKNNNANIRRLKGRVEELSRIREAPAGEWTFEGGRIVENADENRIQIFFDEKPPADVRARLKANGYKWAPSQGAWQRQRTDAAMRSVDVLFPDARKVEAAAPEEIIDDIVELRIPEEPEGSQPPDILEQPARPGQMDMFGAGEDLPLMTGTPMTARESVFRPAEAARQGTLFDMRPQPKGAIEGGEAAGPLFDAAIQVGQIRDGLRKDFITYFLAGQEQVLAGVDDASKQADAVLALLDAHANVWAKRTGSTPLEWYQTHIAGVRQRPAIGLVDIPQFMQEQIPGVTMWYGKPTEGGPFAGRLDSLFVRDAQGVELRLWIDDNPNATMLYSIEKKPNQGVLGYRFIQAMKAYSDQTGKPFGVGMIKNKEYFSRFPWLKPARDFDGLMYIPERTLYQGSRGAVSFVEDGRAILHALQSPDVSTLAHEVGHIFRRDLTPEDLAITEKWAGVTDNVWQVDHEEKFAKGFELYLKEGRAPIPELQTVFQQFAEWIAHVYARMKEYFTGAEINDDMRGVYNRLLAENPDAQAYNITTQTGRARQATLFQEGQQPLQGYGGTRQIPLVEFEDGRRVPLEENTPDAVKNPLGAVDSLHNEVPIHRMEEDGYAQHVQPVLDGLRAHLNNPDAALPQEATDLKAILDTDTARQLRGYLHQVYGQQSDTKLAGVRVAESRRDAALLNYSRRYGLDNALMAIYPYNFWYTRNMINWALRVIDKPSWLANYYRLRSIGAGMSENEGYPQRLKNKMKLPLPFLPEWAGGGVYVDPMRQAFPFMQLAQPFERLADQNNMIARRAMFVLEDWSEEGEVDQQQVSQALQTRAGPLWDKAIAQAKVEIDEEIENPLDFVNTISGMSLPLNWVYQSMRGKKDRIGPLPVTRLVKGVTSALGLNQGRGYNLEGPLRKALGMPEYDRFTDYRVDRMLSNMAAEGLIDAATATQAMIDRGQSPNPETQQAFLEAEQRVAQQGAMGLIGGPFQADLFPEGEQRQRAIKAEYSRAAEAWRAGDEEALNLFFEKYPEYEARLAMYDDPATRLKEYLKSEVWDRYMALPDLHKRQAQEQLGQLFEEAFLDKETRSYDSIKPETLALWAQRLGSDAILSIQQAPQGELALESEEVAAAYQELQDERDRRWPDIGSKLNLLYNLPQSLQDQYRANHPEIGEYEAWRTGYLADHPEVIQYAIGEDNKVKGAKPEIQALYYQYLAGRDRQFPGVMELQDSYYDNNKPKGFLKANPMLPAYWDWRREFMRQYPEMIPYIMSTESLTKAVLGEDTTSYAQTAYSTNQVTLTPVELAEYSPALVRQLLAYYYSNDPLGAGARKELRRIWIKSGRDLNFEEYLAGPVRASVVNK